MGKDLTTHGTYKALVYIMNQVNKDRQLNRKMNKTTQTAISLKKYIMPMGIIPIRKVLTEMRINIMGMLEIKILISIILLMI